MKRAENEPQVVGLNRIDFEKAAGGRKIKATFKVHLDNGRMRPGSQPTQLAKDLVALLQSDESTKSLLSNQHYEFSLSASFILAIKKIPHHEMNMPAEP